VKIRSWSLRPPYCFFGAAPSWTVAKERVAWDGLDWDGVDKRAAVEVEGRAREDSWAIDDVDDTAARDIILIWTLNGARARVGGESRWGERDGDRCR
jgi:hypothetical protein